MKKTLIKLFKKVLRRKSNGESWVEREVAIACHNENPDRKKGEFDYGCACYESALKAYKSLAEDGHNGMSIGFTKHILNRLIDHKPLTPIEDTDDVWSDITDTSRLQGEEVNYQCKRMSSLFKYVYADGTIKYKDIDNNYCINIHNSNNTYHSGLVQQIMDEMFPITMPYYPGKSYAFYCDDLLTDRKNGDFDTVGVFYVIKPDGSRVDINRFFKEPDYAGNGVSLNRFFSKSYPSWQEITEDEYREREANKIV